MKKPTARPGWIPGKRMILAMVLSAQPLAAQFVSVDDFESYTAATYAGGSDAFAGNGGPWESNSGSSTGLVAVENDGETKHLSFGWVAGQRGATRAVPAIADGDSGSYYFRIRTTDGSPNASFGLSDSAAGQAFVYGDFEVQVGLIDEGGPALNARDGDGFVTVATGLEADVWYDVWLVVDNDADTYDVFLGTSGDPSVLGARVAAGLGFRNGPGSNDLGTFMTLSNLHEDRNAHVDDIRHIAGLPAGLAVSAEDDGVEVGVGGAIGFDALANDGGFPDPASVAIVSAPSSGTAKVDPMTGKLIYRHGGGAPGSDSFVYRVGTDGWSDDDDATVNVTIRSDLRIDNVTVEVPSTAPAAAAGELAVVDGLPGLEFPGAVAMTSIPGSPEQWLVASVNGSVWWIPDSTAPSPERHLVMDVSPLSNFNHGRSIYSVVCFPDPVTGAGNLDVILTYQGDNLRLPGGTVPNLDRNGVEQDRSDIDCDLRISRFTLSPAHLAAAADGLDDGENLAALSTEHPYLNLAEQHDFHSINDAKFHWDSSDPLRKYYLYVSFGDEGDQGSPHWNTQKITKDQFSSIIRIDLNPESANPKPNPHYAIPVGGINRSGGSVPGTHDVSNTVFADPDTQEPNFRVPADNPFVHTGRGGSWDGIFNGTDHGPAGRDDLEAVRDEIWAVGMRNPFKMCVERGLSDDDTLVIFGDVGKNDREEFTAIRGGGNGGWGYFEGDIVAPGMSEDPGLPFPDPHTPPIFSYGRSLGNSATGGIVYRGTELAELSGRYLCADFGSGRIWSMDPFDGSGLIEHTALRQGTNKIVDFEVDGTSGDILMLENDSWSGGSARVLRITRQEAVEDYPQKLSDLGIFADFIDPSGSLIPNPGVVGYSPVLKFWSDGADKSRWFVMPDSVSAIGFHRDASWDFPAGTVAVKHFDHDFGGKVVRLETRVIRYDGDATYGVSYRWNGEGSEATLVPAGGLDVSFDADGEVTTDPARSVLDWYVPSRAECVSCHNATSGRLLSLNTRQLNHDFQIGGREGNQLTLLSEGGFLSGFDGDPAHEPRHHRPDETGEDLEARVRSYLDVNCAYCHQPGGNVPPGSWDARAHVPIDSTGLLYGVPVSEGVAHTDHVIVRPGTGEESVLWNRINARSGIGDGTHNGETQMPPIATRVVDAEGVALIRAWIEGHANAAPTVPTSLDVPEGSPIGASVVAALADDPDVRGDVADRNRLTLAVSGGNEEGFFAVDAATGEVTVTGWLDHERSATHVMEVTVSDNFAPNPRVTVAEVTVRVGDVEPEDADGNALPDLWEQSHGIGGATAGEDGDRDGVLDFFEWLVGGDPNSPSSPPQLAVVAVAPDDGGNAVFSWRHVNGLRAGEDYLIQTSSLLTAPSWTTLVEGDDYEVVSESDEGAGYRRTSIRLLEPDERRFLRLASP